jgi:3-phenylpropionate/trans-cinnamate dioxygenase ferredoxin reductase subunit
LADAVALKPQIEAADNVVVIGGGFIGLECAAVARTLGCEVVVLEAMDRLMARVVSPVLSDYYRDLHRSRGVDVRLGASVTEIMGAGGRVTGVRCGDGAAVLADLVVIGIGIIANDDLAKAAGLACDRGIVVDALLRTSDPDIYAIGDCATFPHPMAGGRSGWNRFRTPSTRVRPSLTRSWAMPNPTRPCRGSGPTNTRSSCRSSA